MTGTVYLVYTDVHLESVWRKEWRKSALLHGGTFGIWAWFSWFSMLKTHSLWDLLNTTLYSHVLKTYPFLRWFLHFLFQLLSSCNPHQLILGLQIIAPEVTYRSWFPWTPFPVSCLTIWFLVLSTSLCFLFKVFSFLLGSKTFFLFFFNHKTSRFSSYNTQSPTLTFLVIPMYRNNKAHIKWVKVNEWWLESIVVSYTSSWFCSHGTYFYSFLSLCSWLHNSVFWPRTLWYPRRWVPVWVLLDLELGQLGIPVIPDLFRLPFSSRNSYSITFAPH